MLLAQRSLEQIGGGNRVLDRQVDADPSHRRHGARGIIDAQQAGPIALLQPIDRDREQLHVVPAGQLTEAIPRKGRYLSNIGPESRQAASPDVLDRALAIT